MPEEATLDVTRFVDGDIEKFYPISEGDTKQRKRKPHILAVINENCTGCSGSPACVEYCPVEAVHVLGAGCGSRAVWPHHRRPAAVHWLQTLHQQRAGRRVSGRLSLGRHRHGAAGGV